MEEAKKLIATVPHWHHAFEIIPGVRTPGTYDPTFLLDMLQLPENLRGQRILDIGASDGFFALSLARRGATVVCVDYREKSAHGFGVMEKIAGLQFEYHCANIYDLTPEKLGKFDAILCLGVIYHLPDIVRALYLLRALTDKRLFLETHSDNEFCPDIPAARYYVGDSLHGDWTNFWSPNILCVRAMMNDAGFDVAHDQTWGDRAFVEGVAMNSPLQARKMAAAYGRI